MAATIAPLFGDDNGDQERLRFAACLLTDIAAYLHPDPRGIQAFNTVLHAPLVNISHKERVSLALTLYRRYRGRTEEMPDEQAISLLSWDEQQRALKLGLAMRFVATLAPKVSEGISDCILHLDGDELVFFAPKDREGLLGETPLKRLDSLASAFEARSVIKYEA